MVIVKSDAAHIESQTTRIHSDTITLASDLAEGDFSDILSRLTVTNSQLLIVKSDTSDIRSFLTVIDAKVSDIQSDTNVMYWPGYVRHWYSNDVYKLVHWAQGRRDRHVHLYGKPERLHSCFSRGTAPGVYHWPFPGQGSSGLVSILVALALGYDPITVAGLPFDNSGHFYDPPNGHNLSKGAPWSNFEAETPDRLLERSAPLMRGKVRALSGRLRGYLD